MESCTDEAAKFIFIIIFIFLVALFYVILLICVLTIFHCLYVNSINYPIQPRQLIHKRQVEKQKCKNPKIKKPKGRPRINTKVKIRKISIKEKTNTIPTNVISKTELCELFKEFNPNHVDSYILDKKSFEIQLSQSEEFTRKILTIKTNSLTSGLLHSFVRHWNQWIEFIPDFEPVIRDKLAFIHENLMQTQNQQTNLPDAYKELFMKIKELDLNKQHEIKWTLFCIQMEILYFIRENVKWDQYFSNLDVSDEKIRFIVENKRGFKQLMTLVAPERNKTVKNKKNKKAKNKQIVTIYFESVKMMNNNKKITDPAKQIQIPKFEKFKIVSDTDLYAIIINLYGYECKYFENHFWNCVSLPEGKGFAIAPFNNLSHGLLHTFVFNWDRWVKLIPNLNSLFKNQLEPIKAQFYIFKKSNKSERNPYQEFVNVLDSLKRVNPGVHFQVVCSLFIVQLEILQFLQKMTSNDGNNFLPFKSWNANELHFKGAYSVIGRQMCVLSLSNQQNLSQIDQNNIVQYISNVHFA